MITEWIDSFLEVTANGELSKGVRTVSTLSSWGLVVPLPTDLLEQYLRGATSLEGSLELSGNRLQWPLWMQRVTQLHQERCGSCQISLARQKERAVTTG